jgi:exodeoxyribonuclease-3
MGIPARTFKKPMRIITLNCNGIRAAAKKGFFDWMQEQQADVVCLQETKAQESQLQDELFSPAGYTRYLHDAEKKGYSGTAVYSLVPARKVVKGVGDELIDREGRYLEATFGNVSVVSLYLPSGTTGDERQQFKYRMMDMFLPHMLKLKKRRRPYILCGDWNIAHQKEDIKNWRGNQKNSGFLPEEREWLTELFDRHKFVDAFRCLPQEEHQYTWWSNRGQAWANNTGWRIDYQVCTPDMRDNVSKTHIYKDHRFSDHAPLIIDYDYQLEA